MLDIVTSKLYESIVLGTLGVLLIIISSLNMKIKGDIFSQNPGDIICTKVPDISNIANDVEKMEKTVAHEAVALVWITFIVGLLLVLHTIILIIAQVANKK